MSQYNEIKLLAKDVADKIAAGEVVERPLSIVKELTENSIDAGATSITVEIRKGGKEYIRVSDNGKGIAKDQLKLAFTRHATSKIREDADLNSISTLGFRGEALASIAAVSKVRILSKTANQRTGAQLLVSGSDFEELADASCEDGTSVIVEDLFYNTPARRKFLKAESAEAALIIDFVSKMAIACPQIKIRLISQGNILFGTQGKGDLKKAILTVYGTAADNNLLPVNYEAEPYKMTGYISAPSSSRTNRKYQIFYVNGRLVKNKILEQALDEAYSDKLFDGRYPSAYLFLSADPSLVDVNIHPHKTEIRFDNEDAVSEFAVKAIRRALLNPDSGNKGKAAPVLNQKASESDEHIPAFESAAETIPVNIEEINTFTYKTEELPTENDNKIEEESSVYVKPLQETNFFEQLRNKETQVQQTIVTEPEAVPEKLVFSRLEPVGQVFATYIILRDENYVYFVDQHAAHERIMYEQLLERFNSESNASQLLLMPFIIQLSAAEKSAAQEKLEILASLGFIIEDFGPCEFVVKEIPSCMEQQEAEDFIRNVLENDSRNVQEKKSDIITAACKAAVKANSILAAEEIRELFRRLDLCENPYSCPHGRPTYLRFSQYELERMFKRK